VKVTQVVRVTVGAHEQMSIWVDHKLVGTLTLGLGDGDAIEALLKAEPEVEKVLELAEGLEGIATAALRRIAQLERALAQIGWTHCGKHDVLYVRTDENQCPACWRGE